MENFLKETRLVALPVLLSVLLPLFAFEFIVVSPDFYNALAFTFFIYYILNALTPLVNDFLVSTNTQYVNMLALQNTADVLENESKSYGYFISLNALELVQDLVVVDSLVSLEDNELDIDTDLISATSQHTIYSQSISEATPVINSTLQLQSSILKNF